MDFALNPFFWALISLFGLLGATISVNTKYGKRHPFVGRISAALFTLGRFILVLPLIPQPRFNAQGWQWIAGGSLLIAGIVFILPGIKTQPLGTSKESVNLRTTGLYGFVRHPFYLGEILVSTALSIMFRSIIGLSLVPIWWASLIFHIIHEEENMEKEIGPFYLEYKNRVRGRIIPIPPFQKSPKIPQYPFKNLVFKGGGMKGAAYAGVIEALHNRGILNQIERVAGSSAGAITATLISLNRSYNETLALIDDLDFSKVPQLTNHQDMIEPDWLPRFIGKEISRVAGDVEAIQRLITKYGWYSSEFFYNWIKNVIAKYCDGNPLATFSDFSRSGFKDLYVIGTNISKLTIDVFSSKTTPLVPVANAVRMSMSIPLFFEVLKFDGRHLGEGDLYVDGGVLLNYPIHVFDHSDFSRDNLWFRNGINWETIGFYLYTSLGKENEEKEIHDYRDFISHLYECYNISLQIAEIDNNHLDQRRSVIIDTHNVHATDFHLSHNDEQYLQLVEEGRLATEEYLKNYRHPSVTFNW